MRAEVSMKGRSSKATMTLALKTPSRSRALDLEIWAEGKDYALIRVEKGGPRETGMMTPKRGKQLWSWLAQAGLRSEYLPARCVRPGGC